MQRDIYHKLDQWKNSSRRKPLILYGARQVGKTYALSHFGSNSYKKMVYLNFEKDPKLSSYFSNSLDPSEIIKILTIHSNVEIGPANTLIFFDEIQECPKALNSLKYFCENANEYHVVAAGSLLGIKTSGNSGFPVGKVNILQLFPLTFFEFLDATGNDKLRTFLEERNSLNDSVPRPFHEKLVSLLKYYYLIGGMPEVVSEYAKLDKISIVREVQYEILDAYEKDFAKHAPMYQIMKISNIWNQIPLELAKENKKFIFANIKKSARSKDFEESIQWLLDAGLIYKSYNIDRPKIPLALSARRNIFKLFFLDVGLLGAKTQLDPKAVIEGNRMFEEFKGALTENFVAQELIAASYQQLYYWTSKGEAEVDFVVERNGEIYPLEVKAGISCKKKSLIEYGKKYSNSTLSRTTLMNIKKDGNISNYPLYLVGRFPLTQRDRDGFSIKNK